MRKWVTLAAALLVNNLVLAAPFFMNGWQFHERDVPRLAALILQRIWLRLPTAGINS